LDVVDSRAYWAHLGLRTYICRPTCSPTYTYMHVTSFIYCVKSKRNENDLHCTVSQSLLRRQQ